MYKLYFLLLIRNVGSEKSIRCRRNFDKYYKSYQAFYQLKPVPYEEKNEELSEFRMYENRLRKME